MQDINFDRFRRRNGRNHANRETSDHRVSCFVDNSTPARDEIKSWLSSGCLVNLELLPVMIRDVIQDGHREMMSLALSMKAAEFSHLAKPLIIWADENICETDGGVGVFWEPPQTRNQGPCHPAKMP